jgi:hypothetical protein
LRPRGGADSKVVDGRGSGPPAGGLSGTGTGGGPQGLPGPEGRTLPVVIRRCGSQALEQGREGSGLSVGCPLLFRTFFSPFLLLLLCCFSAILLVDVPLSVDTWHNHKRNAAGGRRGRCCLVVVKFRKFAESEVDPNKSSQAGRRGFGHVNECQRCGITGQVRPVRACLVRE